MSHCSDCNDTGLAMCGRTCHLHNGCACADVDYRGEHGCPPCPTCKRLDIMVEAAYREGYGSRKYSRHGSNGDHAWLESKAFAKLAKYLASKPQAILDSLKELNRKRKEAWQSFQ